MTRKGARLKVSAAAATATSCFMLSVDVETELLERTVESHRQQNKLLLVKCLCLVCYEALTRISQRTNPGLLMLPAVDVPPGPELSSDKESEPDQNRLLLTTSTH